MSMSNKEKTKLVSFRKKELYSSIQALIHWARVVAKNGSVDVFVNGKYVKTIKRTSITAATAQLKPLIVALGDSYKKGKRGDCIKTGSTGAFGNPRYISDELRDFFLQAPVLANYVDQLILLKENVIAQGIYTMLMTIYTYDRTSADRSGLAFHSYRNLDMIRQELAAADQNVVAENDILKTMSQGKSATGYSTNEIFAALALAGITNSSKVAVDTGVVDAKGKAVMVDVKIVNGKYLGVDAYAEQMLATSLEAFDAKWEMKVANGDLNKAGQLQGFNPIDFVFPDGAQLPAVYAHSRHNFAFSDLQSILALNTTKFENIPNTAEYDGIRETLSVDGKAPGMTNKEKTLFKSKVKPSMAKFDTEYCLVVDLIKKFAVKSDVSQEAATAVQNALDMMAAAKSDFTVDTTDGRAINGKFDLGELTIPAFTQLQINDDLQSSKISRANFMADAVFPRA
jgi:hypothetical protein